VSFLVTTYYLIEPLATLADRLCGRTEDDFIELLHEPVLVKNLEGGHWLLSREQLLLMKLQFLASLTDYTLLSTAAGFERLLGSNHLSVELFDQYWTVRRFELDAEATEWREDLRTCALRIAPTGDLRVDQFLEELRSADASPEPG
jgi:hypothetical protein